MILAVEKRKISLSLKPSHFGEEDFETNTNSEDEESETEPSGGIVDANDEGEEDENIPADSDDHDEDAMQVDVDEAAHLYNPPQTLHAPISGKAAPTPSLQLSGGFQWSNNNPQSTDVVDSGSSSEESDVEGQPSKKKKRKRNEIEYDLTADMQTKTPESNADFERVLLGSPNSSYLWIQYMSFHLQLSEIDKAREIARRAIRTINFREEQERLNVWIALLNLENVYGTDEILESVFKEAAQANDSKTIHLRLASILNQAEKHQVCIHLSSEKSLP
jgi:rRNA biogenesis protein RRP5